MISTLSVTDLRNYIVSQIMNIYPDRNKVKDIINKDFVQISLDRLEYCFQKVTLKTYFDGKDVKFNHLFADHYLMLVWFLSNSIYLKYGKIDVVNKLYYLNKTLHGLDCMADRSLPDVFLIFHGVGTNLGKASYNEYFVVLNGCTVGSHKGEYPVFGKGVGITANSSVIGACNIGDRATINTNTTIFSKSIPSDHTAFTNFNMPSNESYAQQFFNVDLKSL